MNIFHDRFTTGQVIAATGLPNHTLQSWLKRDLLIGKPGAPIEGGDGSGSHRRFTFYTIMEIAVAKALADLGLSAAHAIKAAQHFAHTGHGQIGANPARNPGLPFDNRVGGGFTLVCVAGERSTECFWQPGKDVFANLRYQLGEGFVILEINDLFDRVLDALGYHPSAVMEIAYPRKAATE